MGTLKGITKACPECKKIIVRYANYKGDCSFETRCPHCNALVKVNFKLIPCVIIETIKKILTVFILLMIPLGIYLLTTEPLSEENYAVETYP